MFNGLQRLNGRWVGAVLVTFVLLAPLMINDYHQSFLLQVFMVIALAQAWNLISGMTGYVSFGLFPARPGGSKSFSFRVLAFLKWLLPSTATSV
ncbi:MAG: hypothetical protein HY083_01715 [Gammaproteobacteria bacterium]|nr:hypothetical protein [Gammaproteobacteria bacterium]